MRSLVSLLLFIHAFCLVAALAQSSRDPSILENGVVNAVAPYVTFTKIAPNTQFDLTEGSEATFDHFVEVEVTKGPEKGQIVRFPEGRIGTSLVQRRLESLARTMGANTYIGNEPNTAALAKAVGATVLDAGQNEEVEVRVKRLEVQEREFDSTNSATPSDPTDPVYAKTAYLAKVWRDRHGQLQLLKPDELKNSAPLE